MNAAGELDWKHREDGDKNYNGRFGDGWHKEGGSSLGFKKGFKNWDGKTDAFKESKYSAKQIFRTCLNVGNFDFTDEDLDAPGEDFARNSRRRGGLRMKWWMWRSLRPPPCKE